MNSVCRSSRTGRRGFVRVVLGAVVVLGLVGGVSFAVWKLGSRIRAVAEGATAPAADVADSAAADKERTWQSRVRKAAAAGTALPFAKLSLGPVTPGHASATRAVWHPDVDTGLEADKIVAAENWFATFATVADRDGKRFSPDGNGFADPKLAVALIRSLAPTPDEKSLGQPFAIGSRSHRVMRWRAVQDLRDYDATFAGKFDPPAGETCLVVELEVSGGTALPGMFQRDSYLAGARGEVAKMDEKLTDAINVAGSKEKCRLGFVVPEGFAGGPYLSLVLNNGVGWARVELLRKPVAATEQPEGAPAAAK